MKHEQVKNIRKVARELGEVFTDEQLEAMITECEFICLVMARNPVFQIPCSSVSENHIHLSPRVVLSILAVGMCMQLTRTGMVKVSFTL
jgi:hypothetical protein